MSEARAFQDLRASDLAPLEALIAPGYPERLHDIATSLFVGLVDQAALQENLDVSQHQLAKLAIFLTERLSAELGGSNFYMHKGTQFRLSARDREMCLRFNGRNYAELARRYSLTEMRVRQIVDAWAKSEYASRQGTLGLESGEN